MCGQTSHTVCHHRSFALKDVNRGFFSRAHEGVISHTNGLYLVSLLQGTEVIAVTFRESLICRLYNCYVYAIFCNTNMKASTRLYTILLLKTLFMNFSVKTALSMRLLCMTGCCFTLYLYLNSFSCWRRKSQHGTAPASCASVAQLIHYLYVLPYVSFPMVKGERLPGCVVTER